MSSALRHRGPNLEPQYRPIPEHLYPAQPDVRYVQPIRHQRRGNEGKGLFLDWVVQAGRIVFLPITYPLRLILSLLRSPITLSLLIRLILLSILLTVSGIISTLAVGGWWLSWGRMGEISVEGWFVYGSKSRPTPHSYISLPPSSSAWIPDVVYDVEVELELIRPRLKSKGVGDEWGGNFMISIDFLSERTNEPVMTIAQPCLPAQPYVPSSLISSLIPSIPSFPIPLTLNPYTILTSLSPIPLPFSSRKSTSSHLTYSKSHKKSKDTELLTRALTGPRDRGIVMRPSSGLKGKTKEERAVGGLVISVGREDGGRNEVREVKTTGWVVVRLLPRPTGLRWLLTSHPLPPLLILPPIAIFLTLTSALTSYLVITYCFRSVGAEKSSSSKSSQRTQKRVGDGSDGSLFRAPVEMSARKDSGAVLVASKQVGAVDPNAGPPAMDVLAVTEAGATLTPVGSHAEAGAAERSETASSGGDVTASELTSDGGTETE